MTPQEALALFSEQEAYLESLTAEKAPTFLIEADPDDPTAEEPVSLTFINEESLARVKAVLLAELRRSYDLLAQDLAAGITPTHYALASCLQS